MDYPKGLKSQIRGLSASNKAIVAGYTDTDYANDIVEAFKPRRSTASLEIWIATLIVILVGLAVMVVGCRPCYGEVTEASYYTVASCLKESGQFTMSNGKELSDEALTCASWDYRFGTKLRVSRVDSPGKTVTVEVTDRGPAKRLYKKGRKLDLSKMAFSRLAELKEGVVVVDVEPIKESEVI